MSDLVTSNPDEFKAQLDTPAVESTEDEYNGLFLKLIEDDRSTWFRAKPQAPKYAMIKLTIAQEKGEAAVVVAFHNLIVASLRDAEQARFIELMETRDELADMELWGEAFSNLSEEWTSYPLEGSKS